MLKKIFGIIIGIVIAAYLGFYFYTADIINNAIISNLGITSDKVERAGFPLSMNFNIKDHSQYKSFSYNLFTKRIEVDLNFIPPNLESFKYKKAHYKDLEHLRISAKLESYFELISMLKSDVSDMAAFNLTNDYQVEFIALTENPELKINSKASLTFPDKRNYDTMEDFLSDFPGHFSGYLKYNVDSDSKEDAPSFIKKVYELTYPENAEIHFDAKTEAKVDLTKTDFPSMLMALLNVDLKLTGITDTKLIRSEATIDFGSESYVYHAKINATENYKGDALKKLYDALNKEELSEFILLAMHNMDMQLNDNTKSKITMLTGLAWDRTESKINNSPDYWDGFYNLKTKYIANLEVPYGSSKGDAKMLIHVPNESGDFEFKLDGLMKGGISSPEMNGQIYMRDVDNGFAELLGYLRLFVFAIDQKIKADEFKNAIDNFELDIQKIAGDVKKFSDDKNSKNGDLFFSYNVNMKNPMQSTISKSGSSINDFIMYIAGLFADTSLDKQEAAKKDKNGTISDSELNKIMPPENEKEGQDL